MLEDSLIKCCLMCGTSGFSSSGCRVPGHASVSGSISNGVAWPSSLLAIFFHLTAFLRSFVWVIAWDTDGCWGLQVVWSFYHCYPPTGGWLIQANFSPAWSVLDLLLAAVSPTRFRWPEWMLAAGWWEPIGVLLPAHATDGNWRHPWWDRAYWRVYKVQTQQLFFQQSKFAHILFEGWGLFHTFSVCLYTQIDLLYLTKNCKEWVTLSI